MADQFTEFDDPDFDPIAYINSKFQDEASLSGLGDHIALLKSQLETVNKDVMNSIQEHALLNLDVQKNVSQSSKHMENIIQDVMSIKEKAQSSEMLVTEMCKDIKLLDLAKKNLTFSITAIKKFMMMTTAVDQLREFCEARKYKDVANLISAIDDFFLNFKKYENVSQIQSLFKEKEGIISELKDQIREDFIAWGQGHCDFSKETMHEACILVETLGVPFKNEIIKLMCKIALNPYDEEFRMKSENATLEVVERRYPWIQRRIKEIETLYEGVFPHYWGLKCFILHEFCSMTLIHVNEILHEEKIEDVNTLLKALQATLKFESKITQELEKEYAPYIEEAKRDRAEDESGIQMNGQGNRIVPARSRDFVITSIPKLKNSISGTFESYMQPYLDREAEEIKETITKAMGNEQLDPSSDTKVLESSISMFNIFKIVLKRASQYSKTKTMFDIWRVLKESMKFYVDEVLEKLKTYEKSKNKDDFELFCCFVVNTGDYCKDILGNLADTVKHYLEPGYDEKVEADEEEEYFNTMLNKGMEALANYVDTKTEPMYNSMTKINWDKMSEVGDTSQFVKDVAQVYLNHIGIINDVISETYFVYYLNKIADQAQKNFQNSLYKTKKLSDVAIQRLQLDVYELKTLLLGLIKIGSEGKKPPANAILTSYQSYVNKKMSKLENILKLLAMTNEQFMDNLKNFFEDENSPEVEKLMVLKGIKKSDYMNFLKNIF